MNDADDGQATGLAAIQNLMPTNVTFPVKPSTPRPKRSDVGETAEQIGRQQYLRLIGFCLIYIPFDCSISPDIGQVARGAYRDFQRERNFAFASAKICSSVRSL